MALQDLSLSEIDEISSILKKGGIAVLPTETVYGLFCAYSSYEAIEKIFEIKKRPAEKILSLTLSALDDAERFVYMADWQKRTASHFLPGPVTFVFKAKEGAIPPFLVSNEGKTGIRIPDSEIVLKIIKATRIPLASTSANLSGEQPASRFKDLPQEILESVDVAVDAGECPLKVASTVYDLSFFPGKVIRQGAINPQEIISTAKRYFSGD